MGIDRWFNTTFYVWRQVWSGDSSSEQEQSSFSGHIQQAGQELAEYNHLSFSLAFVIWCDESTTVVEGDRLSDGENFYHVKSVRKRQSAGTNKHKELIVEMDPDYISV
jgi:hypothetical protein